jgi:hypothetical protein
MTLLRTLTLSTCFAVALSTQASRASADGPKPIAEQAPTKSAPAAPPSSAKTVATREAPFDAKPFGAIDPTTAKLVRRVEETCHESPFSRDGMSPAEEAKCNAEVARLLGRGALAVPAILARLNDCEGLESYYARTRLYHVLGRQHDQRVRWALVDALTWVSDTETEDYAIDTTMIEHALEQAFGSAPPPPLPWDDQPVVEAWAEARASAARWAAYAAGHRGKTRGQIVAETMTRARKELASTDVGAAYRAIASLMPLAPREAGRAASAYAARDGLTDRERAAFQDLESEAQWRSSPGFVHASMM